MKPSVGRIVHFIAYAGPAGEKAEGGVCRAAIVTEVGAKEREQKHESVDLFVLAPSAMFLTHGVKHDEGKAMRTWHWPERELQG